MNHEMTEAPRATRKFTDIALLVIAFAAVASWLWRRLRQPAAVDAASNGTQALDDKVGGAVGSPPDNAAV